MREKKFRVWMSNDINPNGRMYYPSDSIEVGVGHQDKEYAIVMNMHGNLYSLPADNTIPKNNTDMCMGLLRWSNNGQVLMDYRQEG